MTQLRSRAAGSPKAAMPATRPAAGLGAQARRFGRHPNAWIIGAALLVSAGARISLGGWSPADALVAGGLIVAQPFTEWIIHVVVLHYRPRVVLGREIDLLIARSHRAHHADPTDVDLIFVPRRVLLTGLLLGPVAFLAILPSVRLAFTAITTAAALLAAYEWIHFLIHSPYRPRTRAYRALRRAHRLHHYRNERYWFGVTNPAADHLLGTFPDKDAVAISPTARRLQGTA